MSTGLMASSRPDVVVVGGGLAGIAGALVCADAGATVSLYESRRSLGGAARSLCLDGLEVDSGQHVFLRCCSAYRWLLGRLGATHLTELQSRLDIPVAHPDGRRGRLRRSGLPAPLHLAGALAAYPFLTPAERAHAVLTAVRLRALSLDDPRLDRQTFGSWLSAQGESAAAVESLWDLIGLPTLNLHADEASLLLAARVFQTGLLSQAAAADIGVSRVSLTELHHRAALRCLRDAGVDVHLGAPVKAVVTEKEAGGVSDMVIHDAGEKAAVGVDERATGDAGRKAVGGVVVGHELVRAGRVIVATPPPMTARLLPPSADVDPGALRRLGSSAIVTAHVVFDRPVLPVPFFTALGSPVQWAFDRSSLLGLDRGRYVVVTLSDADDLLREPTERIRGRLVPALAALLPAARRARVERFMVTRERAATFRQSPGGAGLRPGPRTAVAGLYLAGSYTDTGWPDTMESAARSGVCAARLALRPPRRARSEEAA